MDLQIRGQIALMLMLAFVLLAIVLRGAIQYRRTGRTGITVGRMGGTLAEKVVLVSVAVCALAVAATPILALAGVALGGPEDFPAAIVLVAFVVGLLSIVATLWAQLAMGDSWRIGVDTGEHTALVTGGPYRAVRNPIYTAMLAFLAAQVAIVPGVVSVLAFICVLVSLEFAVRAMEEPWLHEEHGAEYDVWAAHAGRFVPAIGRLSAARPRVGTAR